VVRAPALRNVGAAGGSCGRHGRSGGKSGLSVLTVTTMARGTTTLSGTNIRDGMEAAGATTLQQSVNSELASLNFDVVAKNIDPAFAILADVVLHPRL